MATTDAKASPINGLDDNITQYKIDLERGMASLGLKVKYSPNSWATGPGGLAGTDQQRASDLMWAFTDPEVKGIIANRGGWGCNRIVDKLDYSRIAAHPKVFVGFSDLTGCLSAVNTQTGMVTFHGPMGIDDWNAGTRNHQYFGQLVMTGDSKIIFKSDTNVTTIVHGKGRGRLIGGNLSVFHALMGSKYFPNMDSPFVLFLEDVGERSYNIDRMLTTLHLHGMFKQAQALVWGQCTDCPSGTDFTVTELLQQKWGTLLNVPSFRGAMIGHIPQQFTLPIGAQVEVDATLGTITTLEAVVKN